MKIELLIFVSLAMAMAVRAAPFVNDNSVQEEEMNSLQRSKRSSLLAQILYDELRDRLKETRNRPSPMRRLASASIRRRRSTTPINDQELLLSLISRANENGEHQLLKELAENEHIVEDVRNRLRKRSLMAMILKDSLKQRLQEEEKNGRHREIVWGKASREYDDSVEPSYKWAEEKTSGLNGGGIEINTMPEVRFRHPFEQRQESIEYSPFQIEIKPNTY